ncbi:anthranilate synthase component II [Luteibaculum oceani]|uniref:Aminodeoxychorismate/anthranilate synthase component II n=1 Tax=Luteibaculum oceani TaxID=1294296 RepID=A0A5C6V113_9FLAO|nr:aminodeoxychorismate/anthranilate synthase component II [Luteibaculum oceani]TXC78560.1 aminodeoxychorismate/anthranilate synthase component II [Luteibaculum oceani]
MKILLLDNYDSFTYNLEHYLVDLGANVTVVRNDKIGLKEMDAFDAFVFSPGPGLPKDAGILKECISYYSKSKPMLGICLGMQAIAEVFGGKLNNLSTVYHGTSSDIKILGQDPIYKNLPEQISVGRYHSWEVKGDLPSELELTSTEVDSGTIMSLKHRSLPIWGLQYHPESILTPQGKQLLANWMEAVGNN